MKLILALLFLFGLASYSHAYYGERYSCDCGWSNTEMDTRRNEYPWTAAIGYRGNNMSFCAGALVSQRHVITSARCLHGETDWHLFIDIGNFFSSSGDSNTQRRVVEKIMIHPDYNSKKNTNNIGIAMAMRDFVYTREFVGPVCMPFLNFDLTGMKVKVTGWGSLTMDKTEYTQDRFRSPMQADLDVITHGNCEIGKKKLCTEGEGVTFGRSNGGDPLVYLDGNRGGKYTLAGVHVGRAKSEKDATKHVGVFLKVPSYIDWINQQISADHSKTGAYTCHRFY